MTDHRQQESQMMECLRLKNLTRTSVFLCSYGDRKISENILVSNCLFWRITKDVNHSVSSERPFLHIPGQTIVLSARIHGNPTPTVYWTKGKWMKIHGYGRFKMAHDENTHTYTLTVKSVDVPDTGVYRWITGYINVIRTNKTLSYYLFSDVSHQISMVKLIRLSKSQSQKVSWPKLLALTAWESWI